MVQTCVLQTAVDPSIKSARKSGHTGSSDWRCLFFPPITITMMSE